MKHTTLRSANAARQQEWDTNSQITPAYRGNELAGEVGEACNVIKNWNASEWGFAVRGIASIISPKNSQTFSFAAI